MCSLTFTCFLLAQLVSGQKTNRFVLRLWKNINIDDDDVDDEIVILMMVIFQAKLLCDHHSK